MPAMRYAVVVQLTALFITIGIECCVASVFFFAGRVDNRWRNLLIVAATNVVTHTLFWRLPWSALGWPPAQAITILGAEVGIALLEAIVCWRLVGLPRWEALGLAIVMNGGSFGLGPIALAYVV